MSEVAWLGEHMPVVSRFLGIIIALYYDDHGPPHFHARYAGHEATFAIETLRLLEGSLPARVRALVVEWASLHQDELRDDWERARRQEALAPIAPLE